MLAVRLDLKDRAFARLHAVLVDGEGGCHGSVNVVAYNIKDEITVSSDNAHFTATYADGVVTIAAAENTTYEKMEGIVTVTCGNLTKQITVSQAAMQNPDAEIVKGEAYSYTFTSAVFSSNTTKALGSLNWTVAGDGGYWGWDSKNDEVMGDGFVDFNINMTYRENPDYENGLEPIITLDFNCDGNIHNLMYDKEHAKLFA